MVTPVFGTGRSTLFDMVSRLFGSSNCERADFHRLFGNNQYNAWADKPLVMCDETLNSSSELTLRQTSERLKEVLDPRPRKVMVNPKYGKQYETDLHASFLMASNHEEALALPDGDRRVYVIQNATQIQLPAFYMRLNAWLENSPWQDAIWAWLHQHDVDMEFLLSPVPDTEAKREMQAANKYPSDIFTDAVLEVLDAAVPNSWVSYALEQCVDLMDVRDRNTAKTKVRRATRAAGQPRRTERTGLTRWRVNPRGVTPNQTDKLVADTIEEISSGVVALGGHDTQESFAYAVMEVMQGNL